MSWSLLVRGTGGDTRLQRACDDSSREQRSAVQGAVLRKGGRAASRDGVGQAGRQSWADKDQEIGPCERWDRRVPGLRLGSNWCSILGGLAVLASSNRKDKDRRAVKPGRSREFGMIIFERAWGTGESHGRQEHHTRFSPAFQGLVPVQFDTAWAGKRGAQSTSLRSQPTGRGCAQIEMRTGRQKEASRRALFY